MCTSWKTVVIFSYLFSEPRSSCVKSCPVLWHGRIYSLNDRNPFLSMKTTKKTGGRRRLPLSDCYILHKGNENFLFLSVLRLGFPEFKATIKVKGWAYCRVFSLVNSRILAKVQLREHSRFLTPPRGVVSVLCRMFYRVHCSPWDYTAERRHYSKKIRETKETD